MLHVYFFKYLCKPGILIRYNAPNTQIKSHINYVQGILQRSAEAMKYAPKIFTPVFFYHINRFLRCIPCMEYHRQIEL